MQTKQLSPPRVSLNWISFGPRVILFAPCIIFALAVLFVALQGDEAIATYVPDDAFYYMSIGLNAANGDWWTVSGREITTGFSFIPALIYAGLSSIVGATSLLSLFLLQSLISAICLAASLLLMYTTLVSLIGPRRRSEIAAVLALLFITPQFLLANLGLMEVHLVILFVALIAFLYFYGVPELSTASSRRLNARLQNGGLFITCLCLPMIRLDSVTFPLLLALVGTTLTLKRRWVNAVAILTGLVAGIAMVGFFSFLISSSPIPDNVRVKLLGESNLSVLVGIKSATKTLIQSLIPIYTSNELSLLLGALAISVSILLILALRPRYHFKDNRELVSLHIAALITIAVFILQVATNRHGFQLWYVALIMCPIALLVSSLVPRIKQIRFLATPLIAVAGAVSLAQIATAPYPSQSAAWVYTRDLATNPAVNLAGWNVGIPNFLLEAPVSNLDGLVNHEVAPIASQHVALRQYLNSHRPFLILDFRSAIRPLSEDRSLDDLDVEPVTDIGPENYGLFHVAWE